MDDKIRPISGTWGAAECLVCGRLWQLTGPIETQMPRCPSGCFDEALQGEPPDPIFAARDAEIAALRARVAELEAVGPPLRPSRAQLWQTIHRLTAERDALREDAERYRWLRETANPGQCDYLFTHLTIDEWDAYIDAARAAGERER